MYGNLCKQQKHTKNFSQKSVEFLVLGYSHCKKKYFRARTKSSLISYISTNSTIVLSDKIDGDLHYSYPNSEKISADKGLVFISQTILILLIQISLLQ